MSRTAILCTSSKGNKLGPNSSASGVRFDKLLNRTQLSAVFVFSLNNIVVVAAEKDVLFAQICQGGNWNARKAVVIE